jgi:hypothetical protein
MDKHIYGYYPLDRWADRWMDTIHWIDGQTYRWIDTIHSICGQTDECILSIGKMDRQMDGQKHPQIYGWAKIACPYKCN